MVNYNGWLLPVQYSRGLAAEVLSARNDAAIFDVSHMGEFFVEGKSAEAFLQKTLTNDISGMQPGTVIYSPVCYPDGGTVDDILAYRFDENSYLLVVNAANTEKDYAWFKDSIFGDVRIRDISPDYAQIAIQGPRSLAVLEKLCDEPPGKISYYHFRPEIKVSGLNCMVSRTGYTGEDGFEIYCKNADAETLWDALWQAGQDYGISPAGLGARDVLRLEAAMPLYGHELDKNITPLQAGLGRFVAFDKESDFNGRDALSVEKEKGSSPKLYGLKMLDRGVAREGYPVALAEKEIGRVSSGTYSPTLEKSIAMAFLDPEAVKKSEEISVLIRSRAYRARITKLPFYRRVK